MRRMFVLAAAATMAVWYGNAPAAADTTLNVMSWEPQQVDGTAWWTRSPKASRRRIPA